MSSGKPRLDMELRVQREQEQIIASAIPTNVPVVRREAVARARELGADPRLIERLGLAVSEAVTNAVIHAFGDEPGCVCVSVERHDEAFQVTVSDDGQGIRTRSDSPGLGMGLGIIAEVTDHLAIDARGRRGTELRMTFVAGARDALRARG